jgi:predicted methyltransferase
MKRQSLFVALAVFVAACWVDGRVNAQAGTPSFVAEAVTDSMRPADEKALDQGRKPAGVLAFAGIKRGDKVVDLMPGSGYYTRLFSKIVGSQGRVYAMQPTEMDKAAPKGLLSLKGFAGTADYRNVSILVQPIAALSLPQQVDLIWTSQNYHDLHDPFMGSPDMATLNKAIFAALKPGGVYIVLDHAAAQGTGISKTDDLHRIDPAAVKDEVTAAGFEYVGESDALREPVDDHSKPAFDKSMRGKTDRFIYKFRKPFVVGASGRTAMPVISSRLGIRHAVMPRLCKMLTTLDNGINRLKQLPAVAEATVMHLFKPCPGNAAIAARTEPVKTCCAQRDARGA